MNSARTRKRPVFSTVLLLLILSLCLTACDVDTIPEIIAGKIIRSIIEKDYDLIYDTENEAEDIPDYTQPSWESPEADYGTEDEPVREEEAPLPSEASEEETADSEEDMEEDTEEEEAEVTEDERAYYFSTLESPEKKLYMEIYNAIFAMEESVEVSSKDPDEIDRIFNLCMMDHPELFYCDGYKTTLRTQGEETLGVDFAGRYNFSEEERKEKESGIKSVCDRILSEVPDDDSEYEKVKYIYEWIIDNTQYDENAADSQNIISVFLNKKSICQGYTMAFKYLLDKMGIFCTVVYGQAANENHAWNLVRMDGTYCYVDTTFGDSSYLDSENGEAVITSYNYFGCNSEILQRTHTVSERGPLPECTSLDEYYYVKESKYFTEVNEDRLKAVFDHEKEIDSHMFTIRASSEEVYNGLFDTLFTKQEIFNLMPDADKVTYIENKSELTLTFKL